MFIILGMHRSGTSATTGFLTFLGAYPGKNLISGNSFNPKGYFECKKIVDHNNKILKKLNSSWLDFNALNFKEIEEDEQINNETKIIIEEEFPLTGTSTNEFIAIKDPRMCRTLPAWDLSISRRFTDVNYLITLRPPKDVILSLKRRDNLEINHSALIYISYLLDAEKHTRGKRRIAVKYADLIKKPSSIIKEIDFAFNTEFKKLSKKRLSEAYAFIEKNLDHHNDNEELLEEREWNDPFSLLNLAEQLYQSYLLYFEKSTKEFDIIREKFEKLVSIINNFASIKEQGKFKEFELKNADNLLSKDTTSKLYFSYGKDGFSEEKTIQTSFKFSQNFYNLEFNFSGINSEIKELRLDLTDRPACCEVESFLLKDSIGNIHWECAGVDAFDSTCPEMKKLPPPNKEENETVATFINKGFDPYAILKVPEEILRTVENNWRLIIRTRISLLSFSSRLIYENFVENLEKNCSPTPKNQPTKEKNIRNHINRIRRKTKEIKSILSM